MNAIINSMFAQQSLAMRSFANIIDLAHNTKTKVGILTSSFYDDIIGLISKVMMVVKHAKDIPSDLNLKALAGVIVGLVDADVQLISKSGVVIFSLGENTAKILLGDIRDAVKYLNLFVAKHNVLLADLKPEELLAYTIPFARLFEGTIIRLDHQYLSCFIITLLYNLVEGVMRVFKTKLRELRTQKEKPEQFINQILTKLLSIKLKIIDFRLGDCDSVPSFKYVYRHTLQYLLPIEISVSGKLQTPAELIDTLRNIFKQDENKVKDPPDNFSGINQFESFINNICDIFNINIITIASSGSDSNIVYDPQSKLHSVQVRSYDPISWLPEFNIYGKNGRTPQEKYIILIVANSQGAKFILSTNMNGEIAFSWRDLPNLKSFMRIMRSDSNSKPDPDPKSMYKYITYTKTDDESVDIIKIINYSTDMTDLLLTGEMAKYAMPTGERVKKVLDEQLSKVKFQQKKDISNITNIMEILQSTDNKKYLMYKFLVVKLLSGALGSVPTENIHRIIEELK